MFGRVGAVLDRIFPPVKVKPVDKRYEDTYWCLKDELIPHAEALHAHLIDFGTGVCNELNDPEVDQLVVTAVDSVHEVLVQLNSLRVRLINMFGYVPER